jgi:hypothetical protein
MDFLKLFLSFLFSYCVVVLIFIYLLNLPLYITQNKLLSQEYYFDKFYIIFDFFLIIIYLLITFFFIYLFQIKSNPIQLLIMLIIVFCISSFFLLYYKLNPITNSFFSRWFNQNGFNSVFYYMILFGIVFLIMMQFYSLIKTTTTI